MATFRNAAVVLGSSGWIHCTQEMKWWGVRQAAQGSKSEIKSSKEGNKNVFSKEMWMLHILFLKQAESRA